MREPHLRSAAGSVQTWTQQSSHVGESYLEVVRMRSRPGDFTSGAAMQRCDRVLGISPGGQQRRECGSQAVKNAIASWGISPAGQHCKNAIAKRCCKADRVLVSYQRSPLRVVKLTNYPCKSSQRKP